MAVESQDLDKGVKMSQFSDCPLSTHEACQAAGLLLGDGAVVKHRAGSDTHYHYHVGLAQQDRRTGKYLSSFWYEPHWLAGSDTSWEEALDKAAEAYAKLLEKRKIEAEEQRKQDEGRRMAAQRIRAAIAAGKWE